MPARHGLPTTLSIGTVFTFSKTVGEFDIYEFAGISGDFSPNHVNEEAMKKTRYHGRIAHGVLLMAYMSTCSSKAIEACKDMTAVSYGYDHVRFVRPVRIGDTVNISYEISERHPEDYRIIADITAKNQDDDVVAVARHIMQVI